MADEGVPGGFGAKKGEGRGGRVMEPVVAPTYGTSGGYYTDAQGRQITQAQAQAAGRVDRPGEASEKLRSIGGGATTTQIEQRFGIEEALKRGDITRPEAIELTRMNIEGRPLEITRTVEQRKEVRDTQAAEAYFRGLAAKRTGTAQQEAQRRQAIPERVFVTISGKRVPFVSRGQAEQRRPATKIQTKVAEAFEEKNIELSNILKYDTPVPVRNFIDSIDRRAQLSFKGQKPLNPFAFRNVAEAIYGIEKGAVKGVVEEPLTAGTSLLVGGALAKGAGVLAARAPILTKGIGAGKATSKISALNVAGGVMAGYYGADVAKRIAAADNRAQEIGKILSTEIIPMASGAKFATSGRSLSAKELQLLELKRDVAVPLGYGRSSFPESKPSLYGKKTPQESKLISQIELTKKQLQRSKQVLEEETYRKEYKPNVSDYVEDVRVELARLEDNIIPQQAKKLQDLGKWDFSKGKFIRSPKAEAIASRSKSASSIFDRMEKRAELKEMLKVLESVEYQMPRIRGGEKSPIKVRPAKSQIIDMSRSQAIKSPYMAKYFIGSDVKKIGLIQRSQTLQIQREKPVLSPRPEFNLYEGYNKRLADISNKLNSGQLKGKFAPISISSARQSTIAEQKHSELIKNIQKQHSSSVQRVREVQGVFQGQAVGQAQRTTQKQSQSQSQKQIQKQMQQQTQKQKQIQKTTEVKTQKRRSPRRKTPPIPPKDFSTHVENIAKASKKRGKFVWNIKNKIPTLESLIG